MDPNEAFPFLDMEMFWNEEDLNFRVHLKENQELKYLNEGSAHPKACFKSIPTGLEIRQTRLTTITESNGDIPLDITYGEHAKALKKANIAPKKFSTPNEVLKRIKDNKKKRKKKK